MCTFLEKRKKQRQGRNEGAVVTTMETVSYQWQFMLEEGDSSSAGYYEHTWDTEKLLQNQLCQTQAALMQQGQEQQKECASLAEALDHALI